MKYFVVLVACLLVSVPAYADKTMGNNSPACAMQDQISISVNFNLTADSFTQAKAKYDEKIQSITDYANKQNIKKFDLQSLNYNINNNYNNGAQGYQLNGSASFQVSRPEEAFKFAEFLTQQKFNVSVNGNSYKNGMCGNVNNAENRD